MNKLNLAFLETKRSIISQIKFINQQIAASNNARFNADMEPQLQALKEDLALHEMMEKAFVGFGATNE